MASDMPGSQTSKKDKKQPEPKARAYFDATSAQNTLADEQFDEANEKSTSGSYGDKIVKQ
jgi:hypothetical protein